MASGVIDNFTAYHTVTTLSGAHQTIVGGPVASQEVIKDMGNNGGGFFNANSAHPFENPNPFTNWFEIFLLLLIRVRDAARVRQDGQGQPAGLRAGRGHGDHLAGRGRRDQLLRGAHGAGDRRRSSRTAPWRAQKVAFGTPGCSLFAASTTVTSTGAVNCFHDSLTPFGGGIALFDIALGEIAPGGVGAGMYGILVLAMVTVFVAGLMVGRTPEYIGKKIRPTEMKYAALYFLTLPVLILTAAGLSIGAKIGQQARYFNPGPHGLTEIMYAFASMANNNGSAFAGLGTAAPWYNTVGGIVMLLGRFAPEIFALGLAGSLARQQTGARERGHAGHPDTAVRRHARRRDPHPGRPDLLPRPRAGPVRRRTALMSVTTTPGAPAGAGGRPAGAEPHRIGGGPARPQDALEVNPGRVQEAGPAGPDQEPGHVRGRGRRRADHVHGDHQVRRSSTGRSWSGCG